MRISRRELSGRGTVARSLPASFRYLRLRARSVCARSRRRTRCRHRSPAGSSPSTGGRDKGRSRAGSPALSRGFSSGLGASRACSLCCTASAGSRTARHGRGSSRWDRGRRSWRSCSSRRRAATRADWACRWPPRPSCSIGHVGGDHFRVHGAAATSGAVRKARNRELLVDLALVLAVQIHARPGRGRRGDVGNVLGRAMRVGQVLRADRQILGVVVAPVEAGRVRRTTRSSSCATAWYAFVPSSYMAISLVLASPMSHSLV